LARTSYQKPNVIQRGRYWTVKVRRWFVEDGELVRRQVWERIALVEHLSRREAERRRDELLREVNDQVLHPEQVTAQATTFRQAAKLYEDLHLVNLEDGGAKRDKSLLKVHILPAIGDLPLTGITAAHIQALLNSKRAGMSWWTRKGIRAVVHSVYDKAELWGYWSGRNPAKRVSIGRKEYCNERKILTDEELGLLRSRLTGKQALLVDTAVSTGLRISELTGLQWRFLDLKTGRAKIEQRHYRGKIGPVKTTKSRRVVPLGILVRRFEDARPTGAKPTDFVFADDKGRPWDDRGLLAEVLRPLAKELGIYFRGFGWHSFRREHLTKLQEEGASVFEAAAQAGHSSPEVTEIYTIVNYDRREQAVLRLQKRLLEMPAKKEPEDEDDICPFL